MEWGQVVKIGSTEGSILICGDNENPIGVCERTVDQNQIDLYDEGFLRLSDLQCPVTVVGMTGVISNGTIPMNSFVRTGPNGTVVVAPGDGSGNILGICYDACEAGDNTHILVHRLPAIDEPEIDALLLEGGDNFLLESGDLLLLE